ncbi:MAG: rhomboid family intramembrane serine protease [Candidatus Micrarchaeia archaeon]
MRVPVATLLLCVSIVGVYFFLSQGAAYIPNQEFYNLAATTIKNAQTGVLSHLFIHVSLEHLVGNLVPLLIFGALLEFGVAGFDVFVIFFSSGLLTGAFFSFLNPGTPLAGASAAISGVMGAALSLSPRKALVLLIAVPLSLSFLFIPAVNLASEQAKIQTQKQII